MKIATLAAVMAAASAAFGELAVKDGDRHLASVDELLHHHLAAAVLGGEGGVKRRLPRLGRGDLRNAH